MSIQAVVSKAQSSIKTAVTKIQSAPAYATDSILAVPTTKAYADNIHFALRSAGFKQKIFDLKINVLYPRGNLEDAFKWLDGVPDAIADVFRNDVTIGGTCLTYNGDVTAVLASQTIGQVDLIGYVITVPNIKLNE